MINKYFVLLLMIVFAFGCKTKENYIQPNEEKISESVYASGYLKSKNQYQVFSKSSGIIDKIWIKEGEQVKKGQVLFSISNTISKLNEENAQLLASNSDAASNRDKLNELKLTIELSKKKMENDRLVLTRQQKLWSEQIGTKFELEQRELSYSNSKTAYESAKLRYTELAKQVNFLSDQSKKNLRISKTQLDDYNVRSDLDGKIYSILKESGEMVSPQMPLAIIGNANDYLLLLQVDENDIVQIALGQKVFVTMDSYKEQVFEAVVNQINPIMNERSRSFEVEAIFTKQPTMLYPNLTLEANILLQSKEKALTIPRSYLLDDDFVMISPTEKKKVKTGLKDFQKVEIIEGLSKTDKIYLPKNE